MFSGIVSHTSEIQDIKKNKDYWNLCIKSPNKFNTKLVKGASVSVNGVCLTYTEESKKYLTFDVINETLKITNLSKLRKGSVVNLERSLKFSSEIGVILCQDTYRLHQKLFRLRDCMILQ